MGAPCSYKEASGMSGTRRKAGLLGPQVEGYRAWLTQRGYRPTIRNMLKDLGQVGLWLSNEGLEAAHLDEEQMAAFLATRQRAGRRRSPGPRAMVPLLSFLREAGVTPAAKPLLKTRVTDCVERLNRVVSVDRASRRLSRVFSNGFAAAKPRCCVTRTPRAAS